MIRRLQHKVNVPFYAMLVLALVATLGPLGSMMASVAIANSHAEEQQRERDAEAARAQAASRVIVCAWFSAWLDTWDEIPPVTKAGKEVRSKTLELYGITGCLPPRK